MNKGLRGIIILGCYLLSAQLLAQDVKVYDAREDGAAAVPGAEAVEEDPSVKSIDQTDDEDFEALSRELEAQSKAMGAAGAILESPEEREQRQRDEEEAKQAKLEEESMPKLDPNLLALQQAIKGGKGSLDILKDPELRRKLVAAYQNNPMANVPEGMLRGMLQEQLKTTPLSGVVEQFPKVLDFFVNFMRHPRALGQAVKVLERMNDLKRCGYVSIGLIVLVFILRKILIKPKTKPFKRIAISLSTSVLMIGGSLGFLWFSFREEFGPGLEVFKQTFF